MPRTHLPSPGAVETWLGSQANCKCPRHPSNRSVGTCEWTRSADNCLGSRVLCTSAPAPLGAAAERLAPGPGARGAPCRPVLVGSLCLSCWEESALQASVPPGVGALPGGACPHSPLTQLLSSTLWLQLRGLCGTLKLQVSQVRVVTARRSQVPGQLSRSHMATAQPALHSPNLILHHHCTLQQLSIPKLETTTGFQGGEAGTDGSLCPRPRWERGHPTLGSQEPRHRTGQSP